MNITEVKIYKLTDSKTLALASITLDNEFVVSGLKVLNGKNGLWVAFPNRKNKDGEYKDICFPITAEARQGIITTVLDKYNAQANVQDTVQDNFMPDVSQGKKNREEALYNVPESELPF